MVVGKPLSAVAAAEHSLALVGGEDHWPATVRCHVVLGWAALLDFRFSDLRHHLERVEQIGLPPGTPLAHLLLGMLRACLAVEAGDLAAGRAYLAEIEPAADRASSPFRQYVMRSRAEWAFRSHDVAALRSELDRLQASGWRDGVHLYSPMLVALGGDVPLAIEQLTAFLTKHPDGVLGAIAAATRLGLLLQSDNPPAMQRTYRETLDRIAPQRLCRAMAYAGLSSHRLGALVKQDAVSADPHPFTAEVTRALSRYRAFRRSAIEGAWADLLDVACAGEPMTPIVIEPALPDLVPADAGEPERQPTRRFPALTARETDVLRELALGGAYADIARNLYVTENTVKTHIISVYRKLGVDRRADALRRARQLGLLS
jgi:DNA-binding CsgD family transcriptional regulator